MKYIASVKKIIAMMFSVGHTLGTLGTHAAESGS
jgi:hypothetical protein